MKDIITPLGHLHRVYITGKGIANYGNCMDFEASLSLETSSEECETLVASLIDFWEGYTKINELYSSLGISRNKESGKTLFRFTANTKLKDGSPNRIHIFSAGKLGKPPPEIFLGKGRIGNGSIGHIAGKVVTSDKHTSGNVKLRGCRLVLEAIQVIDLKPPKVEGFGFISYEGGFQGK